MSEQNEQQKKTKPGEVWCAIIFLVAIVVGIGGLLRSVWLDGKKAGADEVTTISTSGKFLIAPSQSTTIDYQDSPPVVLKDHKFTDALDYAVNQWQAKLPRYTVKRPELYQGESNTCWEGSIARTIACADLKNYRITIQGSQMDSKIDWPSIMMHEVGHLLGVPHIQTDPLMDSGYTRKVEQPTAFAVALAKIALRDK